MPESLGRALSYNFNTNYCVSESPDQLRLYTESLPRDTDFVLAVNNNQFPSDWSSDFKAGITRLAAKDIQDQHIIFVSLDLIRESLLHFNKTPIQILATFLDRSLGKHEGVYFYVTLYKDGLDFPDLNKQNRSAVNKLKRYCSSAYQKDSFVTELTSLIEVVNTRAHVAAQRSQWLQYSKVNWVNCSLKSSVEQSKPVGQLDKDSDRSPLPIPDGLPTPNIPTVSHDMTQPEAPVIPKYTVKPIPPTWNQKTNLFDIRDELLAIKDLYATEVHCIKHFLMHNNKLKMLKDMENTTNVEVFCCELITHYGKNISEVEDDFERIKQCSDESVARFMSRIQTMYRSLQEMVSSDNFEDSDKKIIKRKFVRGIISTEAKRKLLTDDSVTFEDLVKVARDHAKADHVLPSEISQVNRILDSTQVLLNQNSNRNAAMTQFINNMSNLSSNVSAPRNSMNIHDSKCKGSHTESECVALPRS